MKKLLTRKDASQILGVSLPTIDRMIKDCGLPHLRFGRSVRFPQEPLEALVNENVEKLIIGGKENG